MPETVEKKAKIVKDDEIMGGAARIEGTRVRVSDIFSYYRSGKTPEEIADIFDISLSTVHSAVSYYYSHQKEMKRELSEREELVRQARKKYSSKR